MKRCPLWTNYAKQNKFDIWELPDMIWSFWSELADFATVLVEIPFSFLPFSSDCRLSLSHPNRSIVERSTIRIDFVQSYCKYVLFNDELLDYLPFFKEQNISVINSAPLAMSLLTNSSQVPTWHPADERVKRICLDAGSFCKVRFVSKSFALSLYDRNFPKVSIIEIVEHNVKIRSKKKRLFWWTWNPSIAIKKR